MGGVTTWVLGDQLTVGNPALEGADRVLLIQSEAKLRSLRFHRQKLHLVLSAMHRFGAELREAGHHVELVWADSFEAGIAEHRRCHQPASIRALAPSTRGADALLDRLGVERGEGTLFLTSGEEFAGWAEGRKALRMEDFYRWQRRRLGVLMDGNEPAGGRWNFDSDNREPPPAQERPPRPYRPREDEHDTEVRELLDRLELVTWGDDGPRRFPGSAAEARRALDRFIATRIQGFGPYQDAMIAGEGTMWHSLLSPALNLGLLDPMECVEAAERAYREDGAPIASVEGFVRQIIGWREYVRGIYLHEGKRWERMNALRGGEPLPQVFWSGETDMHCLEQTLSSVRETGYAHHIQRLMVLGNLVLLAGIEPREAKDWFHATFIDAYEWVMEPNVLGMATYADGGVMASKPYAAGGRYIDRMSDYCGACRYRPDRRSGPDACPLSAMYWTFLDRNRNRLADNHRMKLPLRNLERIEPSEMDEIQERVRGARAALGIAARNP